MGSRDVYPAGSRHGYGVVSVPLSCGGLYWATAVICPATRSAHRAARPGHRDPGGGGRRPRLQGAVDAALCAEGR
ncbi:hypothetical protein GCM10010377_61260 [Streptomyces viridiviolaceus]|nr:hypothetical protein GCM10010377_61260 [Streptomyces viridiviolaceus]